MTSWAKRGELLIERVLRRDGEPVLTAYMGYAEPDHLVLQGRVLSGMRRGEPDPEQTRWTNFKQMVSLFITSEVADVKVICDGVSGRTDAEGYITLRVPRGADDSGLVTRAARIEGQSEAVQMPAVVPDGDAAFGVISDIDDTMMHTGAYNLVRNLWTTFTGNALTRRVFDDAKALMDRLHAGGRNPVFYVSSSPWNLHAFLNRIFQRAGLPQGPMFLRDLGVSDKGLVGASHLDHKSAAVDRLIEANPQLNFVLLGDTGQKDAYVYQDAVKRHPGRIIAVVLREPVQGSAKASLEALLKTERLGVPTHHARNFRDLPQRVLPETVRARGAGDQR
ncbi:phosphatase domain-containing protein [Thalassococcus sp. BH17M4-6]|uniref:phosphatase domain-containing protein n=1 Tax=Thalassococcus sp. BH17M4-6 TaxID=3413148 RepID=UPI003BED29ED